MASDRSFRFGARPAISRKPYSTRSAEVFRSLRKRSAKLLAKRFDALDDLVFKGRAELETRAARGGQQQAKGGEQSGFHGWESRWSVSSAAIQQPGEGACSGPPGRAGNLPAPRLGKISATSCGSGWPDQSFIRSHRVFSLEFTALMTWQEGVRAYRGPSLRRRASRTRRWRASECLDCCRRMDPAGGRNRGSRR